jgi:hypothetical protein
MNDDLHVPIKECTDALLGVLTGMRRTSMAKGSSTLESTVYAKMGDGGAYHLEMLFTYVPKKDNFQIFIMMVPVWHMRICSWLFGKSLARNETWLFELEECHIKYLPQRIEAFCREREWWRKYL